MKKKLVITAIVVVIILYMVIDVAVTTSSAKEYVIPEGYQEITDIEGVSFYVDTRLLDMATAIMQITEESGLDSATYYVYKNGTDRYILFNLNKMVIIAQKGTNFFFSNAEDMEHALENSSVCNIWFSKSEKKLQIEELENGYSAEVNAAISITRNLYDDFCGKLVTVEHENEEWSIFVGVPGTAYKDVSEADQRLISNIAESLHLTKDVESTANTQEHQTEKADKNDSAEKEVNDKKEIKESKDKEDVKTESADKHEAESKETDIKKTQDSEEMVKEEVKVQEKEMEENSKQEIPEAKEENDIEKKDKEKELQEPTTQENTIAAKSNQKKQQSEDGKAIKSDIYSMLDIGDSGILSALDYENREYGEPIIKITGIYRGQKAIEMIKANLTEYKYFPAKDGCAYQVVTYDIDYSQCEGKPYVNIKICGLDGTALKFRGVQYTKRTHDIFSKAKQEQNWVKGNICYYEVPNGCKEYVLECGDGTIHSDDSIKSAYYHISEK